MLWSLIAKKDFNKKVLIRKNSSAKDFRRDKNLKKEINNLIILLK